MNDYLENLQGEVISACSESTDLNIATIWLIYVKYRNFLLLLLKDWLVTQLTVRHYDRHFFRVIFPFKRTLLTLTLYLILIKPTWPAHEERINHKTIIFTIFVTTDQLPPQQLWNDNTILGSLSMSFANCQVSTEWNSIFSIVNHNSSHNNSINE